MTTPAEKPKISRAAGRRPTGFDLGNPTGPTNDVEIGPHEPTPDIPPAGNTVAQVAPPAPDARSTYLARSDNQGAQGGGFPPPAPAPAGGSGGMVITLGSLVTQVNPDTDLVQFNTQLPRYMVAAIELMIAAKYGTSKKQEHARRALAGYIPEAFLVEAHRALYPHLPPPGQ